MDLSKLSDSDLKALNASRLDLVSDAGLLILAGKEPAAPKEGVGAALVGGTKRALSSAQTAIESLFDAEEAAKRGLAREEEIGREYAPGASLDKVIQAYKERGILPAAGEAISQIPGAFAEQAPQIAATLGSARAGAMAGGRFGPYGALIGGGLGAAFPSLLQQFGSNIERQAEEGQDISRTAALGAAVPQAALDVVSTYIPLGRSLIGKILGPQAEKALAKGTNESIERLAKETLVKTAGKGVVLGAGVEGGTEVVQQMLERLQAGLPLTTPDALAEYGEAAYGGALVGGPFGAVGRYGERGIARGKVEEKQAEERRLQEQIAEQERVQAEEAEAARKQSPEYRRELNDRFWTLKDELAQVEPIAKDKTQDEDVRNEAIARAKEIKTELKGIQDSIKEIEKATGEAPTLAKAKAAGPREMPVVDEFGNIVKPKTKQLTEEEYGQKLEGAATQWDKTREKIFELREKEEREETAKQIVEQELTQNQPFVKSITSDGKAVPFISYSFDLDKATKPKNISADVWNAATLEQKTDMLKKERIRQYASLLEDPQALKDIQDAQMEAERQKLNLFLEDEASKDQTAAEIAKRKARDEAVQDIAEFQITKARERLGLDALFLGPVRQRRVENAVNQGVVDRYAAAALEIKGLGGRKYKAADVLPNIQEAVNALESERRSLTGKDTINPEGGLTPAGIRLVQIDTKLDEIKRLLIAGAPEQATATEQALAGRTAAEGAMQAETPAVEIESGKPTGLYKVRAEEAQKTASGNFLDLTSYMDDYRKGRFFGQKGAKRDVKLASMTREELLQETEEARSKITDSLVKEIAYRRAEQGLRPFTKQEASEFSLNVDNILAEIINRSTALPSGYFLEEIKIDPAQMRGSEIVKSAETKLRDTRDLKDRQFGAPQRAVEVLAEMIRQAKETAIAEGKRSVRKVKGVLPLKLTAPSSEATPTDLIKDLDRVLRMENLQPDVANTLEAARRRMEEGGASVELEELVEEQVGRILRGTDKPFVTPRGDMRRQFGTNELKNLRAAIDRKELLDIDKDFFTKAELVDDIQNRLRIDSEIAQYAQGEQRTLVPSGKRFVETDVQGALFPETTATTRAGFAQLQRLGKSAAAMEEKAKAAEARQKATEAKQKAEQQAREAEEKERQRRIQAAEIKKEVAPARQVEQQMQQVRDTLNQVMDEYSGKKQAALSEKKKQLDFVTKSVRTRAYKKLEEITNSRTRARLAKDIQEDLAFHFPKEAALIEKLEKEIKDLQEQQFTRIAVFDKRVQNEVKFLKKLEKQAELTEQGTPEQRRAKKQAAIVRGQILKAEQTLKEAKELAAGRESEQKALQQLGLDLPGIRVTAERRELDKGKGVVRRPKIVPIKTKAEVEELKAERAKQRFDETKPLEKDVLTAALAKIERLSSGQRTTQTKLYLQAANDAKRAQADLDRYLKNLRGKEPNKKRIVELRNEVDEANKVVRELNRRIISEMSAAVKGVEEAAIPIRKATARGPIKGEVKWYDKKFTPDQLRDMSGMGLSAFEGTKTYSVDDNIDFRISDREGGGIDLEQANKRMATIEAKAKAMGMKVKYFPTMQDVTVDILNDMERQGVDVYATRIRGGVKPDGTVFVIGENHTDMTDLEKTIGHEFVGHYTVEGILGEQGMEKLMLKIDKDFATKENESGLENLAKELGVEDDYFAALQSAGAFYSQQLADGKLTEKEVRRLAKTKGLREIIAYTMEKRVDENFLQKAQRWIKELVGAVRAAFKNMGADMKFTTSDLFYLMKQAKKTFEEGKPIAYKKADGDIDFAFSKPKAAPGYTGFGGENLISSQEFAINKIKVNGFGLKFRTFVADQRAVLQEVMDRAKGFKTPEGKQLLDSYQAANTEYFMRMLDNKNGIVEGSVVFGPPTIKDLKGRAGQVEKTIYHEGTSLLEVFDPLKNAKIGNQAFTTDAFSKYLVAYRAIKGKLGADVVDIKKRVSEAELRRWYQDGEKISAFVESRKRYNEYNKGLINFLVQAGKLSKEQAAELLKNENYVPYYRVDRASGAIDLLIGNGAPIRIGDFKNQPYLEQLVGGDGLILDVFASSLRNTQLIVDMGMSNLAARNAFFTLSDVGLIEKGAKGIGSGMHKGGGPAGKDILRFSLDGEEKWARVNTQLKEDLFGDIPTDLLMRSMEGLTIMTPTVIKALSLPSNLLRKFIVLNPKYAVGQVFRESLSAWGTSGSDAAPILSAFQNLKDTIMKQGESYEKLRRASVITGNITSLGSAEEVSKRLQHLAYGKKGFENVLIHAEEFARAGEAATKVALYNSFVKQGLSEREAYFATLESANMTRRGLSRSMYYTNQLVLFANAGVQGLDILYRAFTKQMPYQEQLRVKQKLIARGIMVGLTTMAYAAMMQDDEAYKKATPEQRYGNWFIRLPGFEEPFRVPIPFEFGLIFKVLFEGIVDAAASDKTGKEIIKNIGMQAMRSMPGNLTEAGIPIPTAAKPIIELALGKSFYSGRDIVDSRLEQLDKSQQFRDKTPEMLKAAGPILEKFNISPIQAEHFMRSYTGSLGIGLLSIVNPVFSSEKQAGGVEKNLSEMPIIGNFFQPNNGRGVVNDAFDSVKELQRRQNTYKELLKNGETEKATEYAKEHMVEIGLARYAGMFQQQMGELAKAKRAIKAAPESSLSPQEKRERIKQIEDIENKLAENFKRIREQTERQAAR